MKQTRPTALVCVCAHVGCLFASPSDPGVPAVWHRQADLVSLLNDFPAADPTEPCCHRLIIISSSSPCAVLSIPVGCEFDCPDKKNVL